MDINLMKTSSQASGICFVMSRQFLCNKDIPCLPIVQISSLQVKDIHSIYKIYIIFKSDLSLMLQGSGAYFGTQPARLLRQASTQTLTICN